MMYSQRRALSIIIIFAYSYLFSAYIYNYSFFFVFFANEHTTIVIKFFSYVYIIYRLQFIASLCLLAF